jgi:hypothetical protein
MSEDLEPKGLTGLITGDEKVVLFFENPDLANAYVNKLQAYMSTYRVVTGALK